MVCFFVLFWHFNVMQELVTLTDIRKLDPKSIIFRGDLAWTQSVFKVWLLWDKSSGANIELKHKFTLGITSASLRPLWHLE